MNLRDQDDVLLGRVYSRVLLKEERNVTPSQPYNNLVLVLGMPGAGKSVLHKFGLINLDNLVLISPDKWIEIYAKEKKIDLKDPDNTKELHQKFKPIWAKHSERFLSNKSNRANYIIEKIGDNMEGVKTLVQYAKELGYNVSVVLVHVELDTALAGNNQRERKVPEKIIHLAHDKVEGTFDFLVGHPDVQEAWRIDNDTRPGYQDYRTSNFIKKIK